MVVAPSTEAPRPARRLLLPGPTFDPGETTKTITVEVKGDNKKEANHNQLIPPEEESLPAEFAHYIRGRFAVRAEFDHELRPVLGIAHGRREPAFEKIEAAAGQV